MTRPMAAPSEASTRLSVSICRIKRGRLPPRARRSAISLRRESARPSSRLATFAHAINSTTATAAMRMDSADCRLFFRLNGDCVSA